MGRWWPEARGLEALCGGGPQQVGGIFRKAQVQTDITHPGPTGG